ncbi:glycerol-3-phosphate 1-O-acyltransferase PlsY [Candidatus Margulisiibacteriota bacterium]
MSKLIYFLLLAYFTGAIPFALIVSKLKGINLREIGSKNLGTTNVYRAMGLKWASLVFVLDFLKGFIPTILAIHFLNQPLWHVLIGITAVLGHMLSLFVKFKGGKGAATGLGVLLALTPTVFLICAILAVIIIGTTRYVSLATITCSLIIPILIYYLGYPLEYMKVIGIVCILVILKHRGNISRLIKGKENKI